jgi:hypothetical protein
VQMLWADLMAARHFHDRHAWGERRYNDPRLLLSRPAPSGFNRGHDLDRPQHTRFFVHIVQHMHCPNSNTSAKFGDQISVDKVGKSLRLL